MSTTDDLVKLRTLRSLLVEREIREGRLVRPKPWVPLPHFVPPESGWRGFVAFGSRMSGKTAHCCNYMIEHVNGPPCMPGPVPHWMAIVAPTLGDAAKSCFYGPSGIRGFDPTARLTISQGGSSVKWPNGSVANLFGAHSPEDIERLRAGGNNCLALLEELAAWRYLDDTFDQMKFGLRTGANPRWIAATTPRPKPLIKKLIKGEMPNVVVAHGTMYDNPHVIDVIKDELEERYGGTALGAQELHGKLIEEDENALWRLDQIKRVVERPDDLVRVSVGVDPSGGAGTQGIVIVGKQVRKVDGRDQVHGYVLGDYSCKLSPDGWGKRVVDAYQDFEADDIIVETNFGGDMAVSVIRGAADMLGVSVSIKTVTASRGKRVRAEPVAAMAAQGRWHHVGTFDELEAQLVTWTPEAGYSPDRLDAMVWPAWHMKLVGTGTTNTVGSFGGSAMSRTRL